MEPRQFLRIYVTTQNGKQFIAPIERSSGNLEEQIADIYAELILHEQTQISVRNIRHNGFVVYIPKHMTISCILDDGAHITCDVHDQRKTNNQQSKRVQKQIKHEKKILQCDVSPPRQLLEPKQQVPEQEKIKDTNIVQLNNQIPNHQQQIPMHENQKDQDHQKDQSTDQKQKLQESQLKENGVQDHVLENQQLKEKELKEKQLKEKELKEKELKEKELKEKEQRELKEKKDKERQRQAQQLKEDTAREIARLHKEQQEAIKLVAEEAALKQNQPNKKTKVYKLQNQAVKKTEKLINQESSSEDEKRGNQKVLKQKPIQLPKKKETKKQSMDLDQNLFEGL